MHGEGEIQCGEGIWMGKSYIKLQRIFPLMNTFCVDWLGCMERVKSNVGKGFGWENHISSFKEFSL